MRVVILVQVTSSPAVAGPVFHAVAANIDNRGVGEVDREQVFEAESPNNYLPLFSGVDAVVSHSARRSASLLSKYEPSVLDWRWRCSFEQWPFFSHKSCELAALDASLSPLRHAGIKPDARLLFQALTLYTGKTTKSKTHLAYLLSWGTVPVFDVINPLPTVCAADATFAKVHAATLLKCARETSFHLWTRPGYEAIVGYPSHSFTRENLPKAFNLLKIDNLALARRLDAGESLSMSIERIEGTCFRLKLNEPPQSFRLTN